MPPTWRASSRFASVRAPGWPRTSTKGATLGGDYRTGETEEEELALIAQAARAPEEVLRRRFRRHLLPDGVRRPGPHARAPARVQRGGRRLPVPEHPPDPDVRAVRGGPARVRDRRAEEAPSPEDHERRRDLDAVPLRAEWWFRRRRRAHHRDSRRRRVGRQRLEDLDDGRVVLRLRALPAPHQLGRAEAPRTECVHHQDPPAEHRAAPHRDDQRVAGVLPGVHDRPAGSRQRPRRRGRPGLDRRHPLDVPRAQRDGRRLAVRERPDASSQRRDRSARCAHRARDQHRAPRRPAGARPDRRSAHARPRARRALEAHRRGHGCGCVPRHDRRDCRG